MRHIGIDRDDRQGASARDGRGFLKSFVVGGVTGLAWMWLGPYLGLDELSIAVQSAIAAAVGMVGWLLDRERQSRIVDAGQDPPTTAPDVLKQLEEPRGLFERISRAIRLRESDHN